MPTGYADVSTSTPERYAQELLNRLGGEQAARRVDDDTTLVEVDGATVRVTLAPALISLLVEATDDTALDRLEQRLSGMLDAIDEPSELAVEWHRETI